MGRQMFSMSSSTTAEGLSLLHMKYDVPDADIVGSSDITVYVVRRDLVAADITL